MAAQNNCPTVKKPHWLVLYACTILAVVAALFIHLRLERMTGGELPHFVLFYPVVMFASLVAGIGPGLLATAIAAILADYFILPPYGFSIRTAADAVSLTLFCGMGVFMSVVADRYLRLRETLVTRVTAQTFDLQDAIKELTVANEELKAQQEELCTAYDEAMQSETGLLRAKQDWERTFDSVPDLIAIMDNRHRIVRVNRSMAASLGVTAEECVGQVCYRCIHDSEHPPAFCPHAMTVADGGSHEAEVNEERLGGKFLVTTTPLLDETGKIVGSVHIARDITARKQAEEALIESEERVRRKLESIISPEGDIGNLDLADIIDARPMQSLMDNFYKLTRMPMGLIDLKGKVLVGVGWQDVCTKFHRIHPVTCKNCIESDTLLSAGIPPGEYKLYKCKNNMWDVATPIMISGKHFGNIFMGQFFFEDEPLNYEQFRFQARQYGFDEDKYIAALESVPRLDRESLAAGMAYFMELAELISRKSYSNLMLARSLAERDTLMESLRESEVSARASAAQLSAVMDALPIGIVIVDGAGGTIRANSTYDKIWSGPRPATGNIEDYAAYKAWWVDTGELVQSKEWASARAILNRETIIGQLIRIERFDGSQAFVHNSAAPIIGARGEITGSAVAIMDITDIRAAEEALKHAHDELEERVRERTEELATAVETLLGEISSRERAEVSLLRLNRLYAVLRETGQTIVRADNQQTIFSEICRIAVEHGGFRLAWIGLVNTESCQLEPVAATGETGYLDGIRISALDEPAGHGPTGTVLRNGGYYICNNFQTDPCTGPWHVRAHSFGLMASASAAINMSGKVIGALMLYAEEEDYFANDMVELLLQITADISFALVNLRQESRRREAEHALQEETLERLRTAETLREKEQLLIQQSRLAAMGEMINSIAHQWRQPLNTLGLTIQKSLLIYDTGDFNRMLLKANTDDAMKLIRHMSQTIDDFRNFFRSDKEKTAFSVNKAIRLTIALVDNALKNNRIEIVTRINDDPLINGYFNEFSQVLLNILQNASDVMVERKIVAGEITIAAAVENSRTVVTINDNAGGIPEEIIGRIFEPYFSTKGVQGTGIGLFMSKNIIETNMGGSITARNTVQGAEFRIEI